jgi:hypothetical protein
MINNKKILTVIYAKFATLAFNIREIENIKKVHTHVDDSPLTTTHKKNFNSMRFEFVIYIYI